MSSAESIVNIKNVKKPGHKKKLINIYITIFIFIAMIIAAYFYIKPEKKEFVLTDYKVLKVTRGEIDNRVKLTGTVNTSQSDILIATEESFCSTINYKTGDFVEKGSIILVLESSKLMDEKRDLENQIKQVERNNLKSSQVYSRNARDITRSIKQKELELNRAEESFLDKKSLFELNSITKSDLKESEENYTYKKELLELEKLKLSDLEEDRTLDLELLKFDLDNVQTQIDRLNERVDKLQVTSDISGTILNFKIKKGDKVENGTTLLSIGDLSTPYTEAYIPAKYADEVNIGSPVVLKYDKKEYKGEVSLINKVVSESTSGEKLIYVEIEFLEDFSSYLPGSSIAGEVIISKEDNVLVADRGEFLVSGKSRYIYKIEGDRAIRTVVTYGSVNSSKVSITDGLNAGDEFISSSYTDFIDKEIIYLK